MVGAALMPLVLALLVGVVFGGRDGSTMPPIKVVLVDLDQGLLSAMLRSGTGQQETGGERLTLLVAENVEDGLRRLEKEDASALVILPEGLTDDLLDGRKTRLTVYRNPAQSVLPDIVVQGTRIIALGLSILSREFGEPLREIRKMIDSHERPPDWMIAAVAVGVYTRIRAADDYLRSPLITFETLSIDEYKPAHAQHTPTTSENLGESVGG
jgi:hypothetical protein